MIGGTPLFAATSAISIRGLMGALLILTFAAVILLETFGESRYGPSPAFATTHPSAETTVIHWQHRPS